MTSRERIIRTLAFDKPDRLPLDLWLLPAAYDKYGEAAFGEIFPQVDIAGPAVYDPTFDPRQYQVGTYTDVWGCGWLVMQAGMIGEVKHPPLADESKIDSFTSPKHMWTKDAFRDMDRDIKANQHKYLKQGAISVFERMQFIRGTENLYMDIAEESPFFFKLLEIVVDYYMHILDLMLPYELDAISFLDDWGSQRSLLISPQSWDKLFRPAYQALIDKIKGAGKTVFFHSDGYIMDLYPRFIEMGVSAVNSQIWCMGVEEVAKYKGQITFWGELSRQDILPKGTPEEIRAAVKTMKAHLMKNGGGLIGQFEAGPDVSLENIKTAFFAWNEE